MAIESNAHSKAVREWKKRFWKSTTHPIHVLFIWIQRKVIYLKSLYFHFLFFLMAALCHCRRGSDYRVFLNKQTNICRFKYEYRAIIFILFWEIWSSVNIIFTENKWKKCIFSKTWGISVQQKRQLNKKVKSFSDSARSN